MSDITISASAAVAIGAILSSMAGAVGALFWALIASKNEQIKREKELTDKLLPSTEDNTRSLTQLMELMKLVVPAVEEASRILHWLQDQQKSLPGPKR